MGRQCLCKGCNTQLSEAVPENIVLCTIHQVQWEGLVLKYPFLKRFSSAEQSFLMAHLKGCNASELSKITGIPLTTIAGYFRRKRIKGNKSPRGTWQINIYQIIRFIYREKHCISLRKAAKIAGVSRYALMEYYRKGFLKGMTTRNSRGILVVPHALLPTLEKICQILREKLRRYAIKTRNHPAPNEIGVMDLVKIIGVSDSAIHNWIRSGKLKAEKRKNWYVITKDDLADFIQRVATGEVKVKNRIKEKLLALHFISTPL